MSNQFLAGYLVGVALCMGIVAYTLYEREIRKFGHRWLANEIRFFKEYQTAA